jgi:DMSO/TMAO reductase YedYZ molybdopterin-dependent catalytic subunit
MNRRRFLRVSALGIGTLQASRLWAGDPPTNPGMEEEASKLEYLTREENFLSYGRGDPPPHTLPAEKLRQVGLHQDTWRMEVRPDPESDTAVENPLTQSSGTALDWNALMALGEKHAVRFLCVMSCTNGRFPCGMGLWEGVPLREVVWLARPTANVRRVFYYGYHNDDPKQRFQSSLPIGRVLEDPPGELPVILCYKLNGRWLTPKRGGPVRMIVPGEYGNKSVKWIQHVVLTNNYQANDTYALWNNDTVSPLKTCARFIHVPKEVKAGQPAPITGVAQVGMSGLSRVQYYLCRQDTPLPADDPYLARAPWADARILPAPSNWGGDLPDARLPAVPRQIDPATGTPYRWPIPNAIAHWVAEVATPDAGAYCLRCRTIDANGIAQPMPRPFPKSGNNEIQRVEIVAT